MILPATALNELPARKCWKRKIFQRRRVRRQRQERPVVAVVKKDAELDALERQRADTLALIAELDDQRASLEKQAAKLAKRIDRRKKTHAK